MSEARLRIKNYYLLCSVGSGKIAHLVSQMPKKELNTMFTAREREAYFRELDGQYISREHIIGGRSHEDTYP